jgi:hypothetical protein
MPTNKPMNPEARLQAEVERAVAPFAGKAPPFMLAKLRELAERFYRENPGAARALRLADEKERARSGNESTAPEEERDKTGDAPKRGPS